MKLMIVEKLALKEKEIPRIKDFLIIKLINTTLIPLFDNQIFKSIQR